jgi:hypothetical protein
MTGKNLQNQVQRFCFLIALSLLAFSCKKDVYLYDKVGFVEPKTQLEAEREFFKAGAPANMPSYYPSQQYVQPQPYYEPQYAPRRRQQQRYANPYEWPPRNYHPYYYDSDSYYVPPHYYNNSDTDQYNPNLK